MKSKKALFILLSLIVAGIACKTIPWKKIKSEEGNFEIMFPGEPKFEIQNIPTAVGNIKGYMYSYVSKDNSTSFLIMYTDFPAHLMAQANPTDVLNSTLGGQVRSVGGNITRQKEIYLDDIYPGLEAQYENQQAIFLTRIYIRGNRLYQLLSATSDFKGNKDVIMKFFDSFKIIE